MASHDAGQAATYELKRSRPEGLGAEHPAFRIFRPLNHVVLESAFCKSIKMWARAQACAHAHVTRKTAKEWCLLLGQSRGCRCSQDIVA